MVLNNFLCDECGETKEYKYRNAEIDDLRCSACGSEKLKLRISAAFTLNTKERLNSALKKRSLNDHKKNFDDRLDAAKTKYDNKLI